MDKEQKEKIQKDYEEMVKNFPFQKYQDIVNEYMKLFNHPSSKNGLLEYVQKHLLDKKND